MTLNMNQSRTTRLTGAHISAHSQIMRPQLRNRIIGIECGAEYNKMKPMDICNDTNGLKDHNAKLNQKNHLDVVYLLTGKRNNLDLALSTKISTLK